MMGQGGVPKLFPGQVQYELYCCNPHEICSTIVQALMGPKLASMSKAGITNKNS